MIDPQSLSPQVSIYHSAELLIFALIALLGGALGCGLLELYSFYRTHTAVWRRDKPLLLTCCTGIVTVVILHSTGLYLRSYSFSLSGLFEYDFLKLGFLTQPLTGTDRSLAEYSILASSQAFLTLIGTNCPVS